MREEKVLQLGRCDLERSAAVALSYLSIKGLSRYFGRKRVLDDQI